MNFNFFTSLFTKQTKKLNQKLPDNKLLQNIQNLCNRNGLTFYKNINIYHHSQSIFIPLIIIDPKRGIYLFEYKTWSFQELNRSKIKYAPSINNSENTLSYDKKQKFITRKYNEILHNDVVDIFNFLLIENLGYEEYDNLSSEVQKFLPYEKIIFNNSSNDEIIFKLNDTIDENTKIPNQDYIVANLLTQYLVLSPNNQVKLATKEQIDIIDNINYDIEVIYGHSHSGKTTTILLKALLLKLIYPKTDLIIIKPTTLSCDKFKVQLLKQIEYCIIDVDITSIKVITPSEFKKLNKISGYIFCDDTNLLEDDFINYLYSKTKSSSLTLVNPKKMHDKSTKLTINFADNKKNINFINANPIANAMQIISNYSNDENIKNILCISNNTNKIKLNEDLEYYVKDKALLLDSSKNLIDQEESNLILSDYENINTQQSDIVILLDIDEASEDKLAYAINLANEIVYIIYEQECDKITNLKKIFTI